MEVIFKKNFIAKDKDNLKNQYLIFEKDKEYNVEVFGYNYICRKTVNVYLDRGQLALSVKNSNNVRLNEYLFWFINDKRGYHTECKDIEFTMSEYIYSGQDLRKKKLLKINAFIKK
jgi:hypothetical protein